MDRFSRAPRGGRCLASDLFRGTEGKFSNVLAGQRLGDLLAAPTKPVTQKCCGSTYQLVVVPGCSGSSGVAGETSSDWTAETGLPCLALDDVLHARMADSHVVTAGRLGLVMSRQRRASVMSGGQLVLVAGLGVQRRHRRQGGRAAAEPAGAEGLHCRLEQVVLVEDGLGLGAIVVRERRRAAGCTSTPSARRCPLGVRPGASIVRVGVKASSAGDPR